MTWPDFYAGLSLYGAGVLIGTKYLLLQKGRITQISMVA